MERLLKNVYSLCTRGASIFAVAHPDNADRVWDIKVAHPCNVKTITLESLEPISCVSKVLPNSI